MFARAPCTRTLLIVTDGGGTQETRFGSVTAPQMRTLIAHCELHSPSRSHGSPSVHSTLFLVATSMSGTSNSAKQSDFFEPPPGTCTAIAGAATSKIPRHTRVRRGDDIGNPS